MVEEIEKSGAPENVAARLDRADGLSFGIATLVVLAVYLFTLAPEVTVTWSGVMSASAMYGGVAPPPGYPAWTIYSWLFIKLLPFSNIAWRVAVGSAVAGAVACGLVALMVSRSGWFLFHEMTLAAETAALPGGSLAFERFESRERILIRVVCGCVAGLGLGFSGRFWNESAFLEYWTFTVLLFVIMVYLLMRWAETRRRRFCWLAFFAYGLLLTSSEEYIVVLPGIAGMLMLVEPRLGRDISLVVLPLGAALNCWSGFPTLAGPWGGMPILNSFAVVFLLALAMTAVTRKIGTEWKSALACGLFFLLGLGVFIYLPIVSMTNPPMNWAYPRTVEGFFHLVSRGQFERANPTASLGRFATQLWGLFKDTGSEFGWIYLVFAALPFGFLWRTGWVGWKWILSLLPIFICAGPLLVVLVNPEFSDADLSGPYFFALRALVALWAGIGLMIFAAAVASPVSTPQQL